MGENKVQNMARENVIDLVTRAWLPIDHDRVAEKGTRQVGPCMPMQGPLLQEDVFKEL